MKKKGTAKKSNFKKAEIPINSKWFNNVAKSLGYASMEMVKEMIPSIYETVEENASSVNEIIESYREGAPDENILNKTISQVSPLLKLSNQAMQNVLEDIKSGDFYNNTRSEEITKKYNDLADDDMFDFDDEDFDFGDDFDEDFDEDDMFSDVDEEDVNVVVKPTKIVNKNINAANVIPAAKAISELNAQNTMATVTAIKGTADQDRVFEVQRVMRDTQFNQVLFGSLSSINENLSNILTLKTENEEKFFSVGMSFFGEQIELMTKLVDIQKGDDRTPEEIKDDERAKTTKSSKPNIFLSEGGLDLTAYASNIISNMKEMDEFEDYFSMTGEILGSDYEDLEQLIAAPLRFIPKAIINHFVPGMVKDSIQLIDTSISSFTGAFVAKLNAWADSDTDDDIIGGIKSFIGRMFGYNPENKQSANLGEYEKGEVPFDGITRKTIVDVIPTYLRRIESAITNSSERVYDYDTGTFQELDEMKKSYTNQMNFGEISGQLEIMNRIDKALRGINLSTEQEDSFRQDVIKYFKAMNDKGGSINPFIRYDAFGNEIDELYDNDLFDESSENKELFRRILNTFDKPTLMRMMGSNIFDSIEKRTNRYYEIEQNPTISGYKYFNDKSIKESDYETDEFGAKVRKRAIPGSDKYGLNSLDYLRDIRSILLNGINVFISGGRPSADTDPNNNIRARIDEENSEYAETIERRRSGIEQRELGKRDINDVNKLTDSQLSSLMKLEETEEEARANAHFLESLRPNSRGPLGQVRDRLREGMISVTSKASENINNFLYRIIFGDDEDKGEYVDNYLELTKTKLSAFHSWVIYKVYEPVKESFIGENGIITKLKNSTLFKKLTEKKNIFIDKLLGIKDEAGNRIGGLFSTARNKVVDFFKAVQHSFTGKSYTDSNGIIIPEDEDAMLQKIKRGSTNLFNQSKDILMGKNGEDGLVKRAYSSFMDGMERFKETIFGKATMAGYESEGRKSMGDFFQDIKSKLPKAFGKGLVFSFAKFAFASKLGVFGSLLMPGGVLGSLLSGTVLSLVTQSETFKNWAFGEKDPEDPNRRLGGFIPKSLQDFYHDNKIKLGIGAGAGVITSFFLPGGPIFGALLGMGSVFASKTDAFQEFLYGPDFAKGDKSLMNGFFGRAYGKAKDFFDRNGIDPKLATFLGGLGAGAGALGLIPTFFLPGGPIGGALLGMAGGIAASSNRFQTWLFGEKDFDGKRSGGIIDKFKTFFDIEVIDSLKITMKEWNLKISDFLYDHVAEPFLAGIEPMKQILIDAATGVKNMFSNGWNFIKENVLGVFKDNVIKPFGDSLKKFVVDPLKKMLKGTFGLLGKFVGGIISAPFKLFGWLGNRADANATTDEEKAKRDKVKEAREARAAKRAERREQVQSEINELKENQKRDREYFRRDGRFRNEKQKEKWETEQREKELWYQQHIAESGAEAADKLDEINKAIASLEALSPQILYSLEENILKELRYLRDTAKDQLSYFRSEGYVDTRYLRKEKEEETKPVTNFDRQMWLHEANTKAVDEIKKGASGPTISQHLQNDPTISNEAKRNQNPTVNSVIGILRKYGQSHDEGLDSVPYDGYVAELHKGERIIPSAQADDPLKVIMVGGYLDVVKTIGETSGTEIDDDAMPVLEKIKKHTKTSADMLIDNINGVGWNLHHIRKMMQYITGLNEADTEKINDVNLAGGLFSQIFGRVRRGVSSVFDFITKPFKNLFNIVAAPFKWMNKTVKMFANTLANVVNKFLEIPGKIIDVASDLIKGASKILFKGLEMGLKGVTTVVSDLYKGSRWLVTTIAKNFVPILTGAGKLIGSVFTGIAKTAGVALHAVAGLGKGIYTVTKDILGFTYKFGKDLLKGAWNIGKDVAKGLWNVGKSIVSAPFKMIGKLFGKVTKTDVQKVEIVGGKVDSIKTLDLVKFVENVKTVDNVNGETVSDDAQMVDDVDAEGAKLSPKERLKNVVTQFPNTIKNAFTESFQGIKDGFSTSGLGVAGGVKGSIIEPIKNTLTQLSDGVTTAKENITNTFTNISQTITDKMVSIKDSISNTFANIVDTVTKPFKLIGETFNKLKEDMVSIKDGIINSFNGIKDDISNVFTSITDKVTSIKDGITNAFTSIKDAITAPFKFMGNLFTGAKDKISGIKDKIVDKANNISHSIYENGLFNIIKNKFSGKNADGTLSASFRVVDEEDEQSNQLPGLPSPGGLVPYKQNVGTPSVKEQYEKQMAEQRKQVEKEEKEKNELMVVKRRTADYMIKEKAEKEKEQLLTTYHTETMGDIDSTEKILNKQYDFWYDLFGKNGKVETFLNGLWETIKKVAPLLLSWLKGTGFGKAIGSVFNKLFGGLGLKQLIADAIGVAAPLLAGSLLDKLDKKERDERKEKYNLTDTEAYLGEGKESRYAGEEEGYILNGSRLENKAKLYKNAARDMWKKNIPNRIYTTAKTIGTRAYDMGKSAANTVGKTVNKMTNKFGFGRTSVADDAVNGLVPVMQAEILDADGKAIQGVTASFVEVADDVATENKGLIRKFLDLLSDALGKAVQFIGDKLGKTNLASKIDNVVKPIVSKLTGKIDDIIKKYIPKIASFLGITTLGTATAGILDVGFAIWDVATGQTKSETANLFGVKPEQVNARMRAISAALKALSKFSWIEVIYLANEIAADLIGVNLIRWLAGLIYKLVASDEEAAELSANQDAMEAEWKAYNEEHGTNLSKEAFIDMQSPTVFEKMINSKAMQAIAKPFSKSEAANALGKKTDDVTFGDRVKYFGGMAVNGVMNLFRSEENEKTISEFFGKGKLKTDEKGNVITDENGNPTYYTEDELAALYGENAGMGDIDPKTGKPIKQGFDWSKAFKVGLAGNLAGGPLTGLASGIMAGNPQVQEYFRNLADKASEWLGFEIDDSKGVLGNLSEGFKALKGKIQAWWTRDDDDINKALDKDKDSKVTNLQRKGWGVVKAFNWAANFFRDEEKELTAVEEFDKIKETFTNIGENIWGWLGKRIENVKTLMTSIKDGFTTVKDMISGWLGFAQDEVDKTDEDDETWGNTITSSIRNGWNKFKSFFKFNAYEQGTPWVPDTQVALIHEGEMIVPAEYNPLAGSLSTGIENWVPEAAYTMEEQEMAIPGLTDTENTLKYFNEFLSPTVEPKVEPVTTPPLTTPQPTTQTATYDPNNMQITLGTGSSLTINGMDTAFNQLSNNLTSAISGITVTSTAPDYSAQLETISTSVTSINTENVKFTEALTKVSENTNKMVEEEPKEKETKKEEKPEKGWFETQKDKIIEKWNDTSKFNLKNATMASTVTNPFIAQGVGYLTSDQGKQWLGEQKTKAIDGYNYAKDKVVGGYNYAKDKVVDGYNYTKDKAIEGYNYAKDKTIEGYNYTKGKVVDGYNYAKDKMIETKDKIVDAYYAEDAQATMLNRILTGDKNAEATHGTRAMYDLSKFTTKLYNLNPFIDEENKLTEEEGAALLADRIKTKIMEPIEKAKGIVVEKFNEMKDAAATWIDETKTKVVSFYNDKIKEPVVEKYNELKDSAMAWIAETKTNVTDWYNEKIKEPFKDAQERAKKTQQAIFDSVNETKTNIINWYNEKIAEPLKDAKDAIVEKYEELKESAKTWIGETKTKVIDFYNTNIKEPIAKAQRNLARKINDVKTSAKAWIEESKTKVVDFYNTNVKEPLAKAKGALLGKINNVKESAKTWIGETKTKVIDFYNTNIKEPIAKAKGALSKGISNMKESAKNWISESKEKVIDFYNDNIKEPLSKLGGAAKRKLTDMTNSVKTWVSDVKNKVVDAFNQYIKQPVTSFVNTIIPNNNTQTQIKQDAQQLVQDNLPTDSSNTTTESTTNDNLGSGSEAVKPLSQQIKAKNYVFNEQDSQYTASDAGTTVGRLRDKGNTHNFPFYSQLDQRWGREKLIGQSTLGRSGCGPTAAAMVLTHLTGEYITPDTMARVGSKHLPGYASYGYFPEVARQFKLNYNEISGNDSAGLISQLKSGKPVILSGFDSSNSSATPFTNEGHIVVATGIDGGYVQINDPRGPAYSGSYHINDIMRGLKQGVVYTATKQTSEIGLPSSGSYSNDAQMVDEYSELEAVPYDPFNPLGSTGAGQVTVADRVLAYARAFLANTSKFKYSQAQNNTTGRHGIDHNNIGADCSSFVSHVISVAGDTGKIAYLSQSFWDSAGIKVDPPQIGDVVCQEGHVGLYSGDGKYIHMSGRRDGIKESKAIQRGNQPHRGYKRVLKNPAAMVDPTIVGGNSLLGTVVATPSGIPVSSDGAPIGSTTMGGVDGTTGTAAPQVNELGVFDQLSMAMSSVIASMYNGKLVDLSAQNSGGITTGDTPGGTTPGGTTPTPTGTGNFPKYKLNDAQIKGIANILQHEQPGVEGRHAEASLMANLVDKKGDEYATTENLIKKATGGWFAKGKSRFNNPGNPEQISIDAVKSVLIEGKRTLPRYVDEHDCFSDLEYASNNGVNFKVSDRSQYKPHVTKIKNTYGASGTFYTFPNSKSDPFYYTSEELRKKWGEDCYSIGANATPTTTEENAGAGWGEEPLSTRELVNLYGENAGMDPAEETSTTSGTTPGGIPTTMNNFAYYKQSDPTWNDSLISGYSIADGGCGPTTLAMIATQLSGKIITPVAMSKAAAKAGHWKGYALWSLFDWFGEKFGLNTKVVSSNDLTTAKEELKKGNVMAVSGKTVRKGSHTPYTGGHIVPFIGLDGSNKIIVNDSRGPQYAHAYEDSGLAQGTTNHMRQGWSYSGQIKIPSDIEVSGDYTGGGGVAGPQASLDKALLIGDSLTVGMKPVLEGKYPDANAMGKGGKWATQWLQDLGSLPDPESVGTVIQWLGINGVHNNTKNMTDSQTLLTKLKEKYPNVPIMNMDIFPTTKDYSYGDYTGEWWRGLSQEFNTGMSTWASSNGVHQINATTGFIQEDGFLDPSKAVDGIHLTTEGYQQVLNNIEGGVSSYNSSLGGGSTPGGMTGGVSQVDELGVFDQLSRAMSSVIASMYNGKLVDLSAQNSGGTAPGGTTPGSGGLTPGQDVSGISDNEQAVWTYFTSRGYTPQATAGIMGNMYQESGVNPAAIQGGGKGPAAGICQWENINTGGARWGILKKYADSKGVDWKDLQTQLEYLEMELAGDQSKIAVDTYTSTLVKKRGGLQALKSMTDGEEAMYFFEKTFERAGKPNYPRRIKAVNDYLAKFGGTTAGAGDMFTPIQNIGLNSLNESVYFSQGDAQWNNVSYDGNMLSNAGCGPTSLAMIASQLTGQQITPNLVAQAAHEDGVWSDSSSWDIFPWFAQQLGLEYKVSGMNQLDELNALLAAKYKVVASGKLHERSKGKTPFTEQGHIVPILGLQNNKYLINDPRGEAYSGLYAADELVNGNSVLRAAYGYKSTSKTNEYLANSRFNPELLNQLTTEHSEEEIVDLGANAGKQYNVSDLYKNAGLGPDGQSKPVTNVVHTYKPETVAKVSKPVSDLNMDILSSLRRTIGPEQQQSSIATDTEMSYIRACLESLNVAVQELKSINENTRQTAENVSNIQVYSANEPISTGTKTSMNDKESRFKNTKPMNKSGNINSLNTEEYKIARMVASFRK